MVVVEGQDYAIGATVEEKRMLPLLGAMASIVSHAVMIELSKTVSLRECAGSSYVSDLLRGLREADEDAAALEDSCTSSSSSWSTTVATGLRGASLIAVVAVGGGRKAGDNRLKSIACAIDNSGCDGAGGFVRWIEIRNRSNRMKVRTMTTFLEDEFI